MEVNASGSIAVIARSEATKQSSFLVAGEASWIASLRSQ
jgi:hypothetical protein